MKGKKCIKLVILFITFLLCLSPSLNASAIKFKAARSINKIEYKFSGISGTQSVNVNNNLIEHLYFNPSPSTQQNIYDMLLYYPEYTLSKNEKYKINLYFQSETETTNIFSSPVCPEQSGATYFIIDNCEIEHIDYETFVTNINQYPDTSGSNLSYPYVYVTQNKIYNYYSMTLYGHWTGNNTNTTRIFTTGPIFFVYNTLQSPLTTTADLTLRLYLGRIVFYNDEENAEDEAAQKELEDRDNIESQSSTTENQADNAGNAAETTGTTLFGAFSQLFTALTNVNGNSCTLPNMQVYSLNLGQMNLCTYDIPPQIMALVSIGMVFIIVPLGIHLVKRMISLYKEITG